MTLVQHIARAAIRWLTPLATSGPTGPNVLAEDPAEEPEDELPRWQMTPAIRAGLQAEAIERQARLGARGRYRPPPKATTEETDSHLRYVQPKPKPKPTRKRVK